MRKPDNHLFAMNIYIDESVHEEHGFLLLAYVICHSDPQEDLACILEKYQINEYHSSEKMHGNRKAQEVRELFINYLNYHCLWGVFVAPSGIRRHLANEIPKLISQLVRNRPRTEKVVIHIDEGIITRTELHAVREKIKIEQIDLCKSHEVSGIQLADLVAALCGVRLREEISQNPKMLCYGEESGYWPTITAELGWGLWASLRQSMYRSKVPLGADLPEMAEFSTLGSGLHISDLCPGGLKEAAEKLFGKVYLGCIH